MEKASNPKSCGMLFKASVSGNHTLLFDSGPSAILNAILSRDETRRLHSLWGFERDGDLSTVASTGLAFRRELVGQLGHEGS
jgi:hypothetical protein